MSNFICDGEKFDLINKDGEKFILKIIRDEDAESSRHWDNVGTMICFHNRYNLGDDHDYTKPRDFLHNLLFNEYSSYPSSQYGKPVYDFIKQGRAEEVKMKYNRSTREWELLEKNYWSSENDWCMTTSYPASLNGKDIPDWFLDDALSALTTDELIELVNEMKNIVILPLYLYDHSGITMNTNGFSCPWDSGQVGFIYCTKEKAFKEYGNITKKNWKEEVEKHLDCEVEVYDAYIRGDTYGFQLNKVIGEEFKEEEEIDSCWGFYGDTLEETGILEEIGSEYSVV